MMDLESSTHLCLAVQEKATGCPQYNQKLAFIGLTLVPLQGLRKQTKRQSVRKGVWHLLPGKYIEHVDAIFVLHPTFISANPVFMIPTINCQWRCRREQLRGDDYG